MYFAINLVVLLNSKCTFHFIEDQRYQCVKKGNRYYICDVVDGIFFYNFLYSSEILFYQEMIDSDCYPDIVNIINEKYRSLLFINNPFTYFNKNNKHLSNKLDTKYNKTKLPRCGKETKINQIESQYLFFFIT